MKPTELFGVPLAGALLGATLLTTSPARAQREGYTYLSYVGPEVTLVSAAEEDTAARPTMPVLPGDALVTGNASRAEAVLADGNVVRLDARSELRFERLDRTFESDDDRTILALARGSAAVEVREVSTRERALRLDTDDATILSPARSVFRVDTGRRGTEVYVLAGKVEVNGRGGRALVRAGEYASVSGDSEIEVEVSGPPRDRFARWVEERRDRTDRRDVTRYVPSEYGYDSDVADFADYGTWSYVSSLGAYAWRPNVGPGWTPYSLGYWRWTPAGLTWVSYEPWGWLPYHYGTWIFDPELGWIWVPGDLYAPAWVYWAYAPGWTGWCPTGWVGGGGYTQAYYRSTRPTTGNERGGAWLPNLRGRVEVTQIDRRGWNFTPTSRIGTRLDGGRDVTRGDRIPFPRGETVFVATAPLRVERGANPVQSVQNAIRRVGTGEGGPVNEGLTSILRRERTLDPAGQLELRRSLERGGWRSGVRPRADARADGGWRSSSSPPPARVERRDADRRDRQGDSGWRAPAPRVIERSTERGISRRDDAPRPEALPARPVFREAPARDAPVREAPIRVAPPPAPPPPVAAPPPPPAVAPAPAPAPNSAPPARREGSYRPREPRAPERAS